MTLEQLMAMGLTKEQAQKVLEAHKEDVKNEIKDKYVPKSRFDEVNEELKTEKSKVSDRDKQISDLKKFEGDKDALNSKIKELQDENSANLTAERKKNAVKFELLKNEQKPHDLDLVLGLIDHAKVDLSEDGTIKGGFKEQYENLVKEKAFLFNKVEQKTDNTNTSWLPKGTKPAEGTGDKKDVTTPEQFGAFLAGVKLQQMGVTPKTNPQNQ